MLAADLSTQLGLTEIGPNHFISQCLPLHHGNNAPIAYGGITAGSAVLAACKTVKPGYFLFSMLGSFHGPTRIDRHLYCRVTPTRDTKTFSTRRVVAYQVLDDQSERVCAEIVVDFHVRERGLFEYSAKPDAMYRAYRPDDPEKTATNQEISARLVRKGLVAQKVADVAAEDFDLTGAFFDVRYCLDSISGQNLNGLAKQVPTSQDHLPIDQKSAAEWLRARQPLRSHGEQMAALVFWMDGALSFLPLNLDHKNLEDAGACSTLDFSLRVLSPDVDINQWHLRERRTVAAHSARTYSESRLWNEKGQLVAVENQTSICRALKKKPVGKL